MAVAVWTAGDWWTGRGHRDHVIDVVGDVFVDPNPTYPMLHSLSVDIVSLVIVCLPSECFSDSIS
jgi:hypothetical protein